MKLVLFPTVGILLHPVEVNRVIRLEDEFIVDFIVIAIVEKELSRRNRHESVEVKLKRLQSAHFSGLPHSADQCRVLQKIRSAYHHSHESLSVLCLGSNCDQNRFVRMK